jgi:predicted porin
MNKKILMGAALILSGGSALAQESVTLYGIVDVGVEYATKVPQSATAGAPVGHRLAMQSGNVSGSRWGLRGTEDLGGGLKAVYTLENGFSTDTGALGQGGRLFGRNAFVGLEGGFGRFAAGRQTTPLFDFALTFDPLGIDTRYSITNQDPRLSSRADNSLKYVGTFGPVSASALYSFGYETVAAGSLGEVAGASKVGREVSVSLKYADGPFGIATVYDAINGTTVALSPLKESRANVAATYDIGAVRAFLGYQRLDSDFATASRPTGIKSNLYWTGVKYQATPTITLTGAAYYQDFKTTDADPWFYAASAQYALSKRTDFYLNLGYAKNKNGSRLGLTAFDAAAPFATSTLVSGSQVAANENQFGAVIGVRHKF